jgi:hypothetical protein
MRTPRRKAKGELKSGTQEEGGGQATGLMNFPPLRLRPFA